MELKSRLAGLRRELDDEIRGQIDLDYAKIIWGIDLDDAKSIKTFVGWDWHLLWNVVEDWVTSKM